MKTIQIFVALMMLVSAGAGAQTLGQQTILLQSEDSYSVNEHGEVVFVREMADQDQVVRVRLHVRNEETLQTLRSSHPVISIPLNKLTLLSKDSTGNLSQDTRSLTQILHAQVKPLCGNDLVRGLYTLAGEPVWVVFEKYFEDPESLDPVLSARPMGSNEVRSTCSSFGHCGGSCTRCTNCTYTFGRCVSSTDCTETPGTCTERGIWPLTVCDCL